MCVFIFVSTIYGPAGLFRKAGAVLALPKELLLGWDTGALGPCQEHNVVMAVGGKFPDGVSWLAEPRRFRGHDSMEFPEQPTDPHSSGSEPWIISFPYPGVLTDAPVDSFIHWFSGKLGSCYHCRWDITYLSTGELNILGKFELSCPQETNKSKVFIFNACITSPHGCAN